MQCDIIYEDNETKVVMLENILFSIDGNVECVPRGFVSDGGSIPKLFQNILNPLDGRYIKCYIVHDWVYVTKVVSRESADKFLRDELLANGMPSALAYSIYSAVRMFRREPLVRLRIR